MMPSKKASGTMCAKKRQVFDILTEADILARMQAHVEGSPSRSIQPPADDVLFDFELDRITGEVHAAHHDLGKLNQRNPGVLNDLIQNGKRLLQRSLSWYTRNLQRFGAAVADAIQCHTIAIRRLANSMHQTAGRVEELATETHESIARIEKFIEHSVAAIEERGIASPEDSRSSQSDRSEFFEVETRLEREIGTVSRSLTDLALELRAVRQELEEIRRR